MESVRIEADVQGLKNGRSVANMVGGGVRSTRLSLFRQPNPLSTVDASVSSSRAYLQ
jgi:hypothetical protein